MITSWKESYNINIVSKSKITLLTKIHIVKVMFFSSSHVWMWSWTIKKAECQRINAFELWCWRKLLRVPWTARKSNQSIPKDINLEYSLEGLMLKLQYLGHLMQKTDSLENILNAGKDWRKKRETEDEMVGWHHWLNGHEFEQTPRHSEGQGSLACYHCKE